VRAKGRAVSEGDADIPAGGGWAGGSGSRFGPGGWSSVEANPSREEMIAEAQRAVKDKYLIEDLAGAGGMSRVFSARQAGTGRRVAVKLLRVRDPSPQLDPTLRLHRRLVNEARSMSRLDHRHLCSVLEVSVQGETPFLVMEWADGVDLRTAWKRLDRRQRLSLFLKIVDAVAAAHADGVVHGDIKPDNILVGRRGEPKIVDFGLARSERDGPMGLAGAGGTPGYAPPESFDGGSTVDPSADVFGLGVLLFELLTDKTPWPIDMAPALLVEQMKRSDPPLPEQFVPDTPPDLQRICLAALERRPADRYPTAEQMAVDLRRSLRRETVAARPTILVRRFDAQVRRTIDATREWLRLGLVTPESAGAMLTRLNGMARADTPWVSDARRVSWSQAALQSGGALVVVGVAVGLGLSGAVASGMGVLVGAWLLAGVLLAGGVWLTRGAQARVGAGLLWAAALAVPAAAWLTVDRGLSLAGDPVLPERVRDALAAFLGTAGLAGPTDRQGVVVACSGVVAALIGRAAARTSAFTLAAFVYSLTGWLALGSVIGAAPAAAMVVLFGACSLTLGLTLDWDEQRAERREGTVRGRPRDARAVLGAAGVCVLGGAIAGAGLLGRGVFGAASFPGSSAAAWGWGLLIGSSVPAFLAFVASQRVTPMRGLLTAVSRSQAALQALAGVGLLEYAAVLGAPTAGDVPWFWLLLAGALASAYVAVRMKWRFVLIVGHAALTLWAVRLLAEAPTATATISRAGAVIGAGLVLIVLAWRLPVWRERRRLRRWSARRRLHRGEPPSASWG